jgi:hypothetical protein
MDLNGIAVRLRRGEIEYVLGRFRTVRAAYSGLRRLVAPPKALSPNQLYSTSIFPNADIPSVVRAMRDEAVFIGLQLPRDMVSEIDLFARTHPLRANYDPDGPTFMYSDVTRGISHDGRPVPLGTVQDALLCPAVRAITNDPVLNAIVQSYLGHVPRRMIALLNWSFASDFTDEERRRMRFQSDYHFDADGFALVYANFYIRDTDRYSGAHVMMKRSHKKKPLRMLLGSAAASEAAVWKHFGRENEVVIEGPAGIGFVQDTSCYHRASVPAARDRLMLAVRYIN